MRWWRVFGRQRLAKAAHLPQKVSLEKQPLVVDEYQGDGCMSSSRHNRSLGLRKPPDSNVSVQFRRCRIALCLPIIRMEKYAEQ